VLVLVFPQRGLQRLIEERQVDLGQVEQLVAQGALLLRGGLEPPGDVRADARRAGAADDDRDPLLLNHA